MKRLVAIAIVSLGGCGVAATSSSDLVPASSMASTARPEPLAPTVVHPVAPPRDWPHAFPILGGGVPREPPAMGPVHVALLAYLERDVAAIDASYREALTREGWTVSEDVADGEIRRFVAGHDAESVAVSIYADGSATIVQTMQIPAADSESER